MRGHPGGEAHTRRMLELAGLPKGARILDMGAGAGETLALLRSLGFGALGLDREPRSPQVMQGDFLAAPFPSESFDAVISQCAFFVSGNVTGALGEAHRLLRPGGRLLLSDLFFQDPEPLLQAAGFTVLCVEDMTPLWREYYLEALWREDEPCCVIPRGKCSYRLLIGERS